MKVAIKNKSEWTYIDAEQVKVKDITLEDLYHRLAKAEAAYNRLTHVLKDKLIVNPDKEYVIQVGKELKRVEQLRVHEIQDPSKPLQFYTVEDGQIVLDKKKVGAIW